MPVTITRRDYFERFKFPSASSSAPGLAPMCGSSHLCIISEVSRSKGASELLTQRGRPLYVQVSTVAPRRTGMRLKLSTRWTSAATTRPKGRLAHERPPRIKQMLSSWALAPTPSALPSALPGPCQLTAQKLHIRCAAPYRLAVPVRGAIRVCYVLASAAQCIWAQP